MAVGLYMDVHIPKAITIGLRLRGVDVLTSQEDGTRQLHDSELLDRALALNRVLFTFDDDLLTEAKYRQENDIAFAGVVYAHPLSVPIGVCVRDLELIGLVGEPEDLMNQVEFLPLK